MMDMEGSPEAGPSRGTFSTADHDLDSMDLDQSSSEESSTSFKLDDWINLHELSTDPSNHVADERPPLPPDISQLPNRDETTGRPGVLAWELYPRPRGEPMQVQRRYETDPLARSHEQGGEAPPLRGEGFNSGRNAVQGKPRTRVEDIHPELRHFEPYRPDEVQVGPPNPFQNGVFNQTAATETSSENTYPEDQSEGVGSIPLTSEPGTAITTPLPSSQGTFSQPSTSGRSQTSRPYACSEPTCDKTFPTPSARKKHERHHMPYEKRQFVCKSCNKRFVLKHYLEHHERDVHSDERAFGCPQCQKRFKREEQMLRHLKTQHIDPQTPRSSRTLSPQMSSPGEAVFEPGYVVQSGNRPPPNQQAGLMTPLSAAVKDPFPSPGTRYRGLGTLAAPPPSGNALASHQQSQYPIVHGMNIDPSFPYSTLFPSSPTPRGRVNGNFNR